MSIYHKEKCTVAESKQFKLKVVRFLKTEKLPYQSIKAFRSYNGEVRVYTGQTAHRLRLRQGRKLMAFKNPDGTYEGEPEAIENLKQNGGSHIYLETSEPIPTKDYLPVFRCDNWKDEKQALKEK